MKQLLLLILCTALSISAHSQTSSGFEKANQDLNGVYKKITEAYQNDTIFLQCLKEAQRQWVKFRDAQVKMKFPPYPDADFGMLAQCKDQYLAHLTEIRIKELEVWLEPVEEGEVCPGSIRAKE